MCGSCQCAIRRCQVCVAPGVYALASEINITGLFSKSSTFFLKFYFGIIFELGFVKQIELTSMYFLSEN